MSGQQSQSTPARLPKSSPNLVKQGPMKATIPMSSVLKQTSNIKSGNSPAVSPTYYWKNRTSPDHSSGQRSPGSSTYKGKPRTMESSNSEGSLVRTASLDTLYLQGHWPRDNFYMQGGILHVDKATQTDESDWLDPRKIHSISEFEDKIEKVTKRQKIRCTKEPSSKHGSPGENTLNTSSQTSTSCTLSPTSKANPYIPVKPLPKSSMRNSVEALNQEIERIVLKTDSESHSSRNEYNENFYQTTPEGRRPPLGEMLRSGCRSVITQTPQEFIDSSHSSGDSQGSSPDQESNRLGTSPHINKFLAREPPDGCEKVLLKSLEGRKYVPLQPGPPPPCTFKLKPSLGSAFQILQPSTSNTVDEDLPLVPPENEELN